jgi:hypothetical protein
LFAELGVDLRPGRHRGEPGLRALVLLADPGRGLDVGGPLQPPVRIGYGLAVVAINDVTRARHSELTGING